MFLYTEFWGSWKYNKPINLEYAILKQRTCFCVIENNILAFTLWKKKYPGFLLKKEARSKEKKIKQPPTQENQMVGPSLHIKWVSVINP